MKMERIRVLMILFVFVLQLYQSSKVNAGGTKKKTISLESSGIRVRRIGCFRERDLDPAIPSVDGTDRIIQGRYRKRRAAIRKCALVAMKLGYKAFGVRRQGLCATGPNAHETYNKHGHSKRCRNGKGAMWANTVYVVSGRCRHQTRDGHCCVFPFIYRGKSYKSCTRADSHRRWCAITPNYRRDGEWGYCRRKSSGRSPNKVKLFSTRQLDYPIMPGAPAQNKPITTDIAFLLDGFSYVGPLNFNREKAFARSISRYVAMKNQNLRIGVATYGSRARLHVRFAQHCNLRQALETFNYIQFPDQAGRRVDRALNAALSYFFPGRVNHCFTNRYLVVVVSGRQTERPMAILKGLQQLPLQFRRHGVRVYVVVVGNVDAVIREHLRRITFRNGRLYVVPSFRKLVTKVGAITWSIRRRMRRQQIYQQRRCIPGSHHKGRVRPKNAKLIKRLSSSVKRQRRRKEIDN